MPKGDACPEMTPRKTCSQWSSVGHFHNSLIWGIFFLMIKVIMFNVEKT